MPVEADSKEQDDELTFLPMMAYSKDERNAITVLKKILSTAQTEEGRLKGLSFVPGPRDVVIATSPKSGTTWMQQICHQLRSGGDMSFSEISQAVPHLEYAHDLGQNLYDRQYPHFHGGNEKNSSSDHNTNKNEDEEELRFFKTHAWADHCPSFPRTIVVIRDPYDVLLSFYNFVEGWLFERKSISLDAFAEGLWLARGVPQNRLEHPSYFAFLVSWYKRRNDANVLFVCYEDLKDDFEGQVKRVADFLASLDARYNDSSRIQAAVRYSTFEFMKEHADQFDEKVLKRVRSEHVGLSPTAGMNNTKVFRGLSGLGKSELSQHVLNKIDEKWRDVVLPVTGCSSYEDLRRQLAQEWTSV